MVALDNGLDHLCGQISTPGASQGQAQAAVLAWWLAPVFDGVSGADPAWWQARLYPVRQLHFVNGINQVAIVDDAG